MYTAVPNEQFVRRLTEQQSRMYAYILALLGDPWAVGDVLQNANVAIWQKAGEYVEGTDFAAWVSRVAYYEVLAYRKRCQRDRLIFDTALLDDVAEEAARQTESIGSDLATLHGCVEKLPPSDKDLVLQRYRAGASVKRLAAVLGKSAGAISQALYRIRRQLAECMESDRLSEDGR
jgi:RNA polymerase sigma-70 factor, ECF subfamily